MDTTNFQKGSILIAELALTGDASFSRSIILLVEHNDEGTVGFVLNKRLDYQLSDLLPEIKNDFKLFKGGPVNQGNLYYLHKIPERLPGSIAIGEGLYWGGDFNNLYEALKNGELSSKEIKFFLGYSGWMPNQLEHEINTDSWIVTPNEFDVLQTDSPEIWKEKIEQQGGEYLIWANSPENPSYN